MKYVCTIDPNGNEDIFLFPRSIQHDAFYETIAMSRNKTRGDWETVYKKAISAGFVSDRKCHGRSETLNLNHRTSDTDLLRAFLSVA